MSEGEGDDDEDARKPSAVDTVSAGNTADAAIDIEEIDDPWEDYLTDDDSDYDLDEEEDDEDPFCDFEQEESAMGVFLAAVYKRLQKELSSGPAAALMDKWLLSYLKKNDYWIQQPDAAMFCSSDKLDLAFTEAAYYRDILVWLPEIRWGLAGVPYCTCCRTSTWVKFHSYRNNHFGRVVMTSAGHYFITSRRYRCNHCKEVLVASPGKPRYNFMGYNPTSVRMLPYAWGHY